MNTIHRTSITSEAWLIERTTLSENLDDLILVANNPNATEAVLLQVVSSLVTFHRWDYLKKGEVVRAILQSESCTENVIEGLFCHPLTGIIRGIAFAAIEDGTVIPEPVFYHMLKTDYVFRDSISMQRRLLKSVHASERIVDFLSRDWRITLIREVAKSPLLDEDRIPSLIKKGDTITTVNLIKHQKTLSDESLYFLRDDPSEKISKAAMKEISARGLAKEDELDAALEDEVSLFFLTASDDEETLLRVVSNPNTPVDVIESLANTSTVLRNRIASLATTPHSLLESMSLELVNAERGSYNYDLMLSLVGNPSNTAHGITSLVDRFSWVRNLILAAFKNPNCPREVVEQRGAAYSSRARIAALRTGFVPQELIDSYIPYERRNGVLVEVIKYHSATPENIRHCYQNGDQKVKDLAIAKLQELNEPLNAD
jgi:hypothetical protein